MLREASHRVDRGLHLATAARLATAERERHGRMLLVGFALLLSFGAIFTLWPFVAALVFAAWAAHLARPLFGRLRRGLHGSERAAGLMTAVLCLGAILPFALAVVALVPAAKSLVDQLRSAGSGSGVLAALVGEGGAPTDGKGFVALAKDYGAGASKALALLASLSVEAMLGALVFFAVFYAILVEGKQAWGWLRDHAPIDAPALDRLSTAFHEAGRGLIVGTGLTALVQGALATVIFAAFGVPRALLLGMLSVLGALVPLTGPMIVWVPVALGLAFTGHVGKAVGVAVLCAAIVGTVDNVLRPWLSRRFNVGMPSAVVLVAMLGGAVVFGGWGLFLGPLLVRLAGETLSICRERRAFGPARP